MTQPGCSAREVRPPPYTPDAQERALAHDLDLGPACKQQCGVSGRPATLGAPIAWNSIAPVALLPYLSGRRVSSGRSRRRSCRPDGGARWIERIVCARAPSLTSVHDPGWLRVGDKMFDGVIPLGEALRPLDLSGPSTRTCRQQQWGSRPRRISMSEDLTRANDLLEGGRGPVGRPAGRLAALIAEPKPGSSGQRICTFAVCWTLGPGRAAA
jgi:hypothetical protein